MRNLATTRGRYLTGASLVMLLVVTGCSSTVTGTALPAGSPEAGATRSVVSTDASPAEQVLAALERTLVENTVRLSTTSKDGAASEIWYDWPHRSVYFTESAPGAPSPDFEFLVQQDEVYIRYADATSKKYPARTWVRASATTSDLRMAVLALDPAVRKAMVTTATEVTTRGTEWVNGATATRFRVVPDRDRWRGAMLESIPAGWPTPSSEEMTELQEILQGTNEYLIDDEGRIVREFDGIIPTGYHDYGAPFEAPDIDEAAVVSADGP